MSALAVGEPVDGDQSVVNRGDRLGKFLRDPQPSRSHGPLSMSQVPPCHTKVKESVSGVSVPLLRL